MIHKQAPLLMNKLTKVFSITSLVLLSSLVNALPEDTQQEIHISSDKATLDRSKGQIIYSGNVKMKQGTLKIEADKVTLIRNEQGLQQVTAKGKPARYEQVLSVDEDKTQAYGSTIIYRTDVEKLTLIKDAGLEKSGNLFTGQKIIYSIKDQRVQADGQSNDNADGRIKMVIQPQDTAPVDNVENTSSSDSDSEPQQEKQN